MGILGRTCATQDGKLENHLQFGKEGNQQGEKMAQRARPPTSLPPWPAPNAWKAWNYPWMGGGGTWGTKLARSRSGIIFLDAHPLTQKIKINGQNNSNHRHADFVPSAIVWWSSGDAAECRVTATAGVHDSVQVHEHNTGPKLVPCCVTKSPYIHSPYSLTCTRRS
jgi:hypothetical protein